MLVGLGGLFLVALAVWLWPRDTPAPHERARPEPSQARERGAFPRTTLYRRIAGRAAPPAAGPGVVARERPGEDLVGAANRERGQLRLDLLRRAVEADPESVPALKYLSDALVHRDRTAAREAAERCLELDPGEPMCHRSMIATYTQPDGLWTNLSTAEVLNARGDPAAGPLYARACEQGNPYACSMAPTP